LYLSVLRIKSVKTLIFLFISVGTVHFYQNGGQKSYSILNLLVFRNLLIFMGFIVDILIPLSPLIYRRTCKRIRS